MFPSGSLSSSSPQVGPEQENLSNIPEPVPVAEKAVDSLPRSLQKQEKSRPKTFKPGKCDIFLEDVPGLVLDDAFYVDRSANREIYRHGCIYEKQVSTFKQKLKARILGFENLRLCDLFDSENSSNRKGIKKSRYFSKSNRSTMQKPPIPIPTDSTETNKEPFVSVTALSNTNLMGHSSTGDALNTCETLNRAVYDKPNDLKSWLNLLELHGKEASFLHFSETYIPSGIDFKPSDRLVVVRKQLAVAERALSANPGCLNLKILMLRMEEMIFDLESKGAGIQSDKVSQPERLDREWAQLVFTYPQVVSVWRGCLYHLMGRCSDPNMNTTQSLTGGHFAKVDTIYKRALSKLSGIISGRILSHRPMVQTAEQTIDLLADYCQWLVQAGYAEKALAIWQAVVEFNCFRPAELDSVPYEQSMLEMELFWSSGVPRFGQPGSEHWRGWYRSRGGKPSDNYGSEKDKKKTEKKSKKTNPIALSLEEITVDSGREELTTKWSCVMEQLKSIATSCEDALIRSSTDHTTDEAAQKLGVEIVPSVLSAAATDEQWVRRGAVPSLTGCASVSKNRTVLYQRGKAWVGLERAREAAGWLPADTMVAEGNQSDIDDEDPERLVLFDDIKHCLLDLSTLDPRSTGPGVDMTNRVIVLQQRLLLHCLAFLGAFDPESAAAYQLPAGKHDGRRSTTILGAWRQLGRAIMSQGHNQRDLGLWQLYGSGYWVAGLVHSTAADDPRDAEPLVKEARRIFNTALQSHPLPTEFPRLDGSQPEKLVDSLPLIAQFYGQQMAPRLELIQCLSSCLPGFIDILAHIDRLRASLRPEPGNSSGRQTTRWSDADSKQAPSVSICDRLCLRHFFSLAIGGLAAFAALRQRHRHPILEQLFTIWSQKVEHRINENILPPEFLFPNQLAYLLPSRAALERRLLPFSLSNVASLRGLLCPLFLAQFTHQLDSFSHQVGQVAAVTLMDQMTGGLRPGARAESVQMEQTELPYVNIYLNPSLLHGSQLELYVNCLPVSMEIIRLSVELERWSSLIAGASVNEFPGCPALGKTSHCAQRVRNAFERAVRANPFFTGWLDVNNQPLHTVLLSSTPSFWAAHLRLIIWRAYMAFGWMCGSALGQPVRSSTSGNVDPRERRQAVKAVFYRAIEDLPWAKVSVSRYQLKLGFHSSKFSSFHAFRPQIPSFIK
ncbi:hypothetical protein D915_007033 [Fasciola hepatica]|uniref:Protein NRDE2 n=1 Tax=Fasciola hepatica TaxID=6192 RepID=A0A4E0R1B4_FASHE|nr:hypothetical protein D915_007033 [Fasciola hepatica]